MTTTRPVCDRGRNASDDETKRYLIPHLQDVLRVGVHRDELIGYGSLATSFLFCPL